MEYRAGKRGKQGQAASYPGADGCAEPQGTLQGSLQDKVFRHVSDAVIATDPEIRITAWNPAAAELYGWTGEEVLGRNADRLLESEFLGCSRQEAQASLAETGIWKGTLSQRTKNGNRVIVEALVSWIRDEKGEITGGVALNRDITGRKARDDALRRSESRYRSIVSALPDLIFRMDKNLYFTDVHSNYPGMLLAPAERIIGSHARDFLPPDIEDLHRARVERALSEQEVQVFHYGMDVNGEFRECETRMVPCGSSEVLAVVREVTEFRRVERELREARARYQAVINDQTELICRFKANGELTFVNRAYCSYFGMSEKELVGRNFLTLIPEEERRKIHKKYRSLDAQNPSATYEHQVIGPGNSLRWMEWTDRAIFGESGNVVEYQAVGRDITERRRLEKLLLEASEKEQQKLGQELHDGLCQDLKSLEIEMSLLESRLAGKNPEEASAAASAGSRLNQAVQTAYALSRGVLPFGSYCRELGPALEELARSADRKTSARVSAEVEKELELPTRNQAHQLYRIAQEALNNALRHSGAGLIRLELKKRRNLVCLAVWDNGSGIDPGSQKEGGMGITVMRSRAGSIEGSLEVKNRKGGGTEVCCRVPLTGGSHEGS